MARKIKLTRPELKHQRDALSRFKRYLPMLKLKQQQLQIVVRGIVAAVGKAAEALQAARSTFEPYQAILSDLAGVNIRELSKPSRIKTGSDNVAGVIVPVFESVEFPSASYSLFATAAWTDGALADLKEINRHQAKLDVLREVRKLLQRELTKVIQRVNLFDKVMIPEATEIIRRIRIHLGDEMTAAVGRAKIAKNKITRGGADMDAGSKTGQTTHEAVNL